MVAIVGFDCGIVVVIARQVGGVDSCIEVVFYCDVYIILINFLYYFNVLYSKIDDVMYNLLLSRMLK